MVRTKGDGGASRTVASKAPRKALGGGGPSRAAAAISAAAGGDSPAGKHAGGNAFNKDCGTPGWQKPLTKFFQRDPNAPPPRLKTEEELAAEGKGKGKGKGKRKKSQSEDEENKEAGGAKKGKKSKKTTKDPKAPKRPMTAYFLFMAEVRDKVKAENPGLKIGGIAKVMGEMWGKMEKGDKEKYEVQAGEAKVKYTEAKAKYDAGEAPEKDKKETGEDEAEDEAEEDKAEEDEAEEDEAEEEANDEEAEEKDAGGKGSKAKLKKNGMISDSDDEN